MDPRTLCIIGMVGFPALAVVNAFYFGNELKRFIDATPTLASTHDVERFKVVVAHQMYAALIQIGLLAAPMLIYFGGLFAGVLGPSDITFIIVPSIVILIVAAGYRGVEKRAKAIGTSDPLLTDQRDAIVHTWMTKPFPDW